MTPEAEYAAHAADAAARLRQLAIDDEWLRLWETRLKVAPDASPFNRRYAAALDAGMARCEAAREAGTA